MRKGWKTCSQNKDVYDDWILIFEDKSLTNSILITVKIYCYKSYGKSFESQLLLLFLRK